MFKLRSTAAEATATIRLAVPQSLHDQLIAAAAEANIEVQEAARQAIAYAFSRAGKRLSSLTTDRANPGGASPQGCHQQEGDSGAHSNLKER